jgi:hypothetical protein
MAKRDLIIAVVGRHIARMTKRAERTMTMRMGAVGLAMGTLIAVGPALAAEDPMGAQMFRLHENLHLAPDQEGSWRDYTAAIAANPQTEARHKATADLLPLVPTPRRIALIQASMAKDAEDFARQGAAVVSFYKVLTPSQQQTFDLDTAPKSGPGGDDR